MINMQKRSVIGVSYEDAILILCAAGLFLTPMTFALIYPNSEWAVRFYNQIVPMYLGSGQSILITTTFKCWRYDVRNESSIENLPPYWRHKPWLILVTVTTFLTSLSLYFFKFEYLSFETRPNRMVWVMSTFFLPLWYGLVKMSFPKKIPNNISNESGKSRS